MQLSNLLKGYVQLNAEQDLHISDLCMLPQDCKTESVFFTFKEEGIEQVTVTSMAIKNGAKTVIMPGKITTVSQATCTETNNSYLMISIPDLKALLPVLAQKFYQPNFSQAKFIGVTGTNGKTSCVRLIVQALSFLGKSAAMIGTLGVGFLENVVETGYTTPDIFMLYKYIAQLIQHKAEYIVMEVSSHALDQDRIAGVPFIIAVFTNLTRDHLDYHASMEDYLVAKKRLFATESLEYAIVNGNDSYAPDFLEVCSKTVSKVVCNSSESNGFSVAGCHYHPVRLTLKTKLSRGYKLSVNQNIHFITQLLGEFNISNLLSVIAVLKSLQFLNQDISTVMPHLTPVQGRLETIDIFHQPLCVVDYAHTPDALEKALLACREFATKKLICIFGCGGDRDQGKRPAMAKVAETYADYIVVTSDNSRTEAFEAIAMHIRAGFSCLDKPVHVIKDRRHAIRHAIKIAQEGDVILIAGKGHESYQITGTKKTKFCDMTVTRELLGEIH